MALLSPLHGKRNYLHSAWRTHEVKASVFVFGEDHAGFILPLKKINILCCLLTAVFACFYEMQLLSALQVLVLSLFPSHFQPQFLFSHLLENK